MSQAYTDYLAQRDALLVIRTRNGGYWTEEEEPILEQMDTLWSQMTAPEIAAIRADGSWKFQPPLKEGPKP